MSEDLLYQQDGAIVTLTLNLAEQRNPISDAIIDGLVAACDRMNSDPSVRVAILIGAGCDLTCMCDIRIAGASARFAESFVKVGIVPGDGGAWLLQRAVGFSKAAEMAFTGDQLSAEEALACGLVSKVVPDEELMTAALALAKRIAANPPQAVRLTKRLLVEGRHSRLDTLLELSATMQALAHTTDDHREAATAFVEQRRPNFTGR